MYASVIAGAGVQRSSINVCCWLEVRHADIAQDRNAQHDNWPPPAGTTMPVQLVKKRLKLPARGAAMICDGGHMRDSASFPGAEMRRRTLSPRLLLRLPSPALEGLIMRVKNENQKSYIEDD